MVSLVVHKIDDKPAAPLRSEQDRHRERVRAKERHRVKVSVSEREREPIFGPVKNRNVKKKITIESQRSEKPRTQQR